MYFKNFVLGLIELDHLSIYSNNIYWKLISKYIF